MDGEGLASSGALINGAWRKDRVQILIFFQRDPQVVWLIVTEAYAYVESQQRISVWPARLWVTGLSICMMMGFTTSVRMAMRMRCPAFLCSCRHLFTLMLLKRTCARLLWRMCIRTGIWCTWVPAWIPFLAFNRSRGLFFCVAALAPCAKLISFCCVVFNYVHIQLCVHTNISCSHLQVAYNQECSHCMHA
jgi:hypothetical protein